MEWMSALLGPLVRHHVELAFKLELFPTLAPISNATRVKHVPLQLVTMVPGLHGQLVPPLVGVVFNNGVVITLVAKHHMFRNARAPSHLVNGAPGQSGPTVRFHVAVPMSFELDSTPALAKSTLMPSTATLTHARIMVPGPTGRPVRPHVVWEL